MSINKNRGTRGPRNLGYISFFQTYIRTYSLVLKVLYLVSVSHAFPSPFPRVFSASICIFARFPAKFRAFFPSPGASAFSCVFQPISARFPLPGYIYNIARFPVIFRTFLIRVLLCFVATHDLFFLSSDYGCKVSYLSLHLIKVYGRTFVKYCGIKLYPYSTTACLNGIFSWNFIIILLTS